MIGFVFLLQADTAVVAANSTSDLATYKTNRSIAANDSSIATVLFVAGGALLAAGGVHWWLFRPTERIEMAAGPLPGGATFALAGRF